MLAELVLGTVGAARNNPFDKFLSIMRRSQVHEINCDEREQKFCFCIAPPPKSIFVFDVIYAQDGPILSGEGYQQYFGLSITSNQIESIYADLSEIRPRHELGVDAAALQKALLKLPYFTSMAQLYERFGNN